MRHRRVERGERAESGRQMRVHPGRRLRPGDSGDSDRSVAAKAFELLGRWRVDKHHRWQAGEGHDLHDGGRAGEIVAVESDQDPGRKAGGFCHAEAICSAAASEGWVDA
jgi:hypothetical protein